MMKIVVLIVIILNINTLNNKVLSFQGFEFPPPKIYFPSAPELAACINIPPPTNVPIINLSDPQITMPTPELIEFNNYPVETHHVISQNGYNLSLFRIPHGITNNERNPKANKSVVVLMHGIFSSSADWLMQSEENALPYLLANAGYDVWLGNARGCKYSLGHSSLDASDSNSPYWDFSMHEMGAYDVPVTIDYILNETGQPNLYWIGHSMGNFILFVTLSIHPEYNDKIRTFFAFAPGPYVQNSNNILFTLFGSPEIYQRAYETLGLKEFIPMPIQDYAYNLGLLCEPLAQQSFIPLQFCNHFLFLIFGYNCPQVNSQMIPRIFGHTPSSGSSRSFAHLMQMHSSGRFAPFDFSYNITPGKTNIEEYGVPIPPLYNLTKVTAPTIFFSGDADNVVTPIDVCALSKNVPGLKEHIQHVGGPKYRFTHVDFMYAKDAKTFVYDPTMKRMNTTPSGMNENIEAQDLNC